MRRTPPAIPRNRLFRNLMRTSVVASLAAFAVVAMPSFGQAQSSVSVQVRAPDGSAAEGRVTLTPDGAETPTGSCQTHAGSCTIQGVAGGRYVVRLEPADGSQPPEPRVVVIPPSGTATLRVSTH